MENLTKQERKISHLIAQGYLEKEIASELFVSNNTVHTHTRNIRKKLNARNIADITRKYILSLDNPRAVLSALAFLIIQFGMIVDLTQFDARKGKERMAKNKIVKVRRYE